MVAADGPRSSIFQGDPTPLDRAAAVPHEQQEGSQVASAPRTSCESDGPSDIQAENDTLSTPHTLHVNTSKAQKNTQTEKGRPIKEWS